MTVDRKLVIGALVGLGVSAIGWLFHTVYEMSMRLVAIETHIKHMTGDFVGPMLPLP